MTPPSLLIHAGLLSLCAAVLSNAQAAPEPGDLWEDTVEMEMSGLPAGMAQRAQTHRRCSPRQMETPPMADQSGRCEMFDLRRSADGMAWKMRCEGNVSGAGEIRYEGRDRYRGAWTVDAGGRTMAMKMSGQRVGECDASEARRQLAAMKQQAAQAQHQLADAHAIQCKSAVDTLMAPSLRADSPLGCEPKYKAEFCRKLQSPDGFAIVAGRPAATVAGLPSGDLKEGAELCGANAEEISARICGNAEQQEALDVLAAGCVSRGYARALVVRECAGRSFSSPPAEKYRQFCASAASQDTTLAGASRARSVPTAAPASPQQEVIDKGRQLLKGLFGR
ncbi:DUF3617 family protein [Piscinibacter sp. XHJ-5]|uniref:DUF3617 domain-containing protein n=1 Tax=Piscinibacter sp. XHJ-5 TaxID=3037797 RepID=UPI002452B824|nr:DUF3617 family protein [Piscinibacter sp. XHJ-5]